VSRCPTVSELITFCYFFTESTFVFGTPGNFNLFLSVPRKPPKEAGYLAHVFGSGPRFACNNHKED
jgi:hypothetical protein